MNIAGNPNLLDRLAASHAVGTMRGGARRRFEAMAREQAPIRAAALAWQGRLASMTEVQPAVPPDPAVWLRIQNVLDGEREQRAMAAQRSANPHASAPLARGWLANLASNLSLWRGASLAGAVATLLAVVVGVDLKHQLDTAPAVQYVAVLADNKAAPSVLVTFDPKNKQLVLQRLGDFKEGSDKSLQLWALPPGGKPRSLGVMSDAPALKLTAAESQVQAVPALAISLEPKGGVPSEGGPTGPVLFSGPLIEKTL